MKRREAVAPPAPRNLPPAAIAMGVVVEAAATPSALPLCP
jgi:hypothetical protein